MVEFNLWMESFKFGIVYSIIIIIPCIFAALIGYKLINQLGRYPSQSPAIHMSIFLKFTVLELFTFAFLIGFYKVFER